MEEKTFDLITVGMALVDSIIKGFDPEPISASGYRAVSGSLNVGGEAVNEAIAAAKLGLNTGILCALGEDAAGDMVAQTLAQSGVCTDLILRGADHPTPVTTMFVRDDGSRKSITNRAHRYNFHPERCSAPLAKTRAVILGSLFRAPFDDPEILFSVLQVCREHGVLVIADTKLPNFRKLTPEDLKDSLPLIDWITPNEDEARYFTGKSDPGEMAEVFLTYGVRNVIVKLGPKGCCFRNAEKGFLLPAYKIDAVDATGAGDNFAAGLAAELLRGAEIEAALRFATACGAICTTSVGACTALRSREQVLAFLQTQGD